MAHPIMNVADVEFVRDFKHGEKFEGYMAPIGMHVGARKLGYNVTRVPPGKRAFPFHSHQVNEEMFFVLEGEGEIRIGDARHPIKTGDVIACPPGGRETAHQIINTGTKEMRYLAVSTKMTPEIAEYPDSNKMGVMHETGPGADGKPGMLRVLVRQSMSIDYWDGEDGK